MFRKTPGAPSLASLSLLIYELGVQAGCARASKALARAAVSNLTAVSGCLPEGRSSEADVNDQRAPWVWRSQRDDRSLDCGVVLSFWT